MHPIPPKLFRPKFWRNGLEKRVKGDRTSIRLFLYVGAVDVLHTCQTASGLFLWGLLSPWHFASSCHCTWCIVMAKYCTHEHLAYMSTLCFRTSLLWEFCCLLQMQPPEDTGRSVTWGSNEQNGALHKTAPDCAKITNHGPELSPLGRYQVKNSRIV